MIQINAKYVPYLVDANEGHNGEPCNAYPGFPKIAEGERIGISSLFHKSTTENCAQGVPNILTLKQKESQLREIGGENYIKLDRIIEFCKNLGILISRDVKEELTRAFESILKGPHFDHFMRIASLIKKNTSTPPIILPPIPQLFALNEYDKKNNPKGRKGIMPCSLNGMIDLLSLLREKHHQDKQLPSLEINTENVPDYTRLLISAQSLGVFSTSCLDGSKGKSTEDAIKHRKDILGPGCEIRYEAAIAMILSIMSEKDPSNAMKEIQETWGDGRMLLDGHYNFEGNSRLALELSGFGLNLTSAKPHQYFSNSEKEKFHYDSLRARTGIGAAYQIYP